MVINFLYGSPTWLMGAAVLAAIIGFSTLGCVVSHRYLPHPLRKAHNDVVGLLFAPVSVFYAVLLALIAMSVWDTHDKAQNNVSREASLVGDLYRDTMTLPEPLRGEIATRLQDYVQVTLREEWPAMAEGAAFGAAGWIQLRDVHARLSGYRPADPAAAVLLGETVRRLNTLYDARRDRILAAQGRLPSMVWGVVILGMTLNIVFTFFLGMESFKLHLFMISAVAASIGLVVVLIVAFDHPFRGQLQVSPAAFVEVQQNIAAMTAGGQVRDPVAARHE